MEAVKRSFAGTQGGDEIMADIEARIAELFTEKMQHDRQVISVKEVDAVIAVMGQPEDYRVDEEIFDDAPKSTQRPKTGKQLFRDTDNKYIGGVSSGLGHFLGIDAIWVRLLWVILAFASGGSFIFVYILFWIIVPEAATTAQKLAMRGEPINISNIGKKVKEGFEEVEDRVKNVDYDKVGAKVKSSSKTFFDTLGDIIMLLFKIFAKFVGVLLIIIAGTSLISLFVTLVTFGSVDFIIGPWSDFFAYSNTTGTPIWLIAVMTFFAVGIPLFFLFLLGLKILITNLKSIGSIAKFTLFGLWIIATVGLIYVGLRQFSETAFSGSISETTVLNHSVVDTLHVKLAANTLQDERYYQHTKYDFVKVDGTKKLYMQNIRLNIIPTEDSIASIKIQKYADGNDFDNARERAQKWNMNIPYKQIHYCLMSIY